MSTDTAMRINNTNPVSTTGARWLCGNLVAMAIAGTLIYYHTRPSQLSGAELRATYLVNADLHNVNLEAAVLVDSDLASANLSGANLRGANLTRANLAGSKLQRANLRDADLRGANLESADLESADLRFAVYDENTSWSPGVDPEALGATLSTQFTRRPPVDRIGISLISRMGE